jgi:hypothetical protein
MKSYAENKGTAQKRSVAGNSSGKKVVQRVGAEKIGFKRTQDPALGPGLLLLDQAITEMKAERHTQKERIWFYVDNLRSKDDISSVYSGKLEELNDEKKLILKTQPFTDGSLSLVGDKVMYSRPDPNAPPDGAPPPVVTSEIAVLTKGNNVFKKGAQPKNTQREIYTKDDVNSGDYVKDDRNVITRRYAYVEKNYWQFMEFMHTHHMEGRYQKLIRAAGGGKGRPDVLDNENEMVKKVQRIKGSQLSLEQLAFVHQYWGSGSQQRGLSLSSTPKPGVTIGNAGDNFRTDGGFRIKIDLSKIPRGREGAILLNHYAHGGVKDVVKDVGGPVNTNPLNKTSPYKYHSSVIKNRELYLEFLKPEWIAGIEYHPFAKDTPGAGKSREYSLTGYGGAKNFMKELVNITGSGDFGAGFELALIGAKSPFKLSGHFKNGYEAGIEYLKGFKEGSEELLTLGTKRGLHDVGEKKKHKDWSESKRKKDKESRENEELAHVHIANLTIEDKDDQDQTDIFRIGYIHGRMGKTPISKLSQLT